MNVTDTYSLAVSITASDSTNFEKGVCDAIYVGGAGTVVVVLDGDVTATFVGATAGSILPIRAQRVNSTSTTATYLLALYKAS